MSSSASTFTTQEPLLDELLTRVGRGDLQLPDFQRGWVWDDEHIRALLASVTLSYPIGAVMLMETGGDGVRFKNRVVEGVDEDRASEPSDLILDGQQRLTSLYLALKSDKAVPTRTHRNQPVDRVYYLDIERAIDPRTDRIDAFIALPPDRITRTNFARDVGLDLSSPDKEYEKACIPIERLLDSAKFAAWRNGFQQHWKYAQEKMELFQRFESDIYLRLLKYKVPVIRLLKATPKDAVCQVFEKVNTGGVALTVFELLTATFAADGFSLRDDWKGREERFGEHDLLGAVSNSDFLTAVTLHASAERSAQGGSAVSCKRSDVLRLELSDYKVHADRVENGFKDAERLLQRTRIFERSNVPYPTQLIPLSVICAMLGPALERNDVKEKLTRWLWCGVFGELYGSTTETRFAHDVPGVLAWVKGGEPPRTVQDATFSPTRLLGLQTRNSAAYKGVMALLLEAGSRDFMSGDEVHLSSYAHLAIDIHHIFPATVCQKANWPKWKWNSVVNKAALTARCNRSIGGNLPSSYIEKIEKQQQMEPSKLDEILRTHLIAPDRLRADDFDGFIRARATLLLDAIARAMGKPVPGRSTEDTVNAFGGPV